MKHPTFRIGNATNRTSMMNKGTSPGIGRSLRHSLLWVLLVGAQPFTAPVAARADDGSFVAVPPNTSPFGATFGEWSARWWQWFDMLPADASHPSNWSGPSDCGTGQLGPVWFLVGISVPPGPVTISCHIPEGKALFFPIVNAECSNVEADPFHGATPQARRQCAQRDLSGVDNSLVATVDGHAIKDLKSYGVASPDFDFVVPPAPNVLGTSAGAFGQSGSFGYFLMLVLSAGPHTIHFAGEVNNPTIGGFKIDTTYKLTIER